MKKIILSFVFVFIVSFIQAQEVITTDTCRAQVVYSDGSIEINPEPSERCTEEVWDIVLKDLDFKDVEEVRAFLEPYDFHSVDCFLDTESGALVFCFEKVIIWKKEQ